MFVYASCVGPSGKLERVLKPSLERFGLGPLIVRHGQSSIFDAYNDMLNEVGERWPDCEGVALIHEDVQIRGQDFEVSIREALESPSVGVVGAVGGTGHEDVWWGTSPVRHGHVEHATWVHDYDRGTHDVDTVDGLLMVLSPQAVREVRLDGRGYPGFHGYDAELCAKARQLGMRVVVTDLDVYHDCKLVDWTHPEIGWASYEWRLRWQAPAAKVTRLEWKSRRMVLRQLALRGISLPSWAAASD